MYEYLTDQSNILFNLKALRLREAHHDKSLSSGRFDSLLPERTNISGAHNL
jgi:hypothetical protein